MAEMKTREELIAHIEKVEGERDRARELLHQALCTAEMGKHLYNTISLFLEKTSLVKP